MGREGRRAHLPDRQRISLLEDEREMQHDLQEGLRRLPCSQYCRESPSGRNPCAELVLERPQELGQGKSLLSPFGNPLLHAPCKLPCRQARKRSELYSLQTRGQLQ